MKERKREGGREREREGEKEREGEGGREKGGGTEKKKGNMYKFQTHTSCLFLFWNICLNSLDTSTTFSSAGALSNGGVTALSVTPERIMSIAIWRADIVASGAVYENKML